MNKYNGLLSEAAAKYRIYRGEGETENDWKTRIIYSICTMMAYASLWDEAADSTISIAHLKARVRDMLANYKLMYPELVGNLPLSSAELEEEIFNLFIKTGVVYHRPNRIAAAARSEETFCGICFQRGISLENICGVSGAGFYSLQNASSNPEVLKMMFGLERESLLSLWNSVVSSAVWQKNPSFEQTTEYLRLKAPFYQGYWVNQPDKSSRISILRTGLNGAQSYYLYRYFDSVLEVSPLQQWRVESHNYRTLASACISAHGALPPIEYFEDEPLIHLQMNYLLPPRELEFLKLYSWPEECTSLPCNFRRILSRDVFNAIKALLEDEGYEFRRRRYDA